MARLNKLVIILIIFVSKTYTYRDLDIKRKYPIYSATYAADISYNGKYICSGILITREFLLTLADCVCTPNTKSKKRYLIRTGNSNFGIISEDHMHNVKKVHCHPKYDNEMKKGQQYHKNNIAIIELREPIPIIPKKQDTIYGIDIGSSTEKETCIFFEWHETTREFPRKWIRTMDLLQLNTRSCRIYLRKRASVKEEVLCAEADKNNIQTLTETGSPLICKNGVVGQLISTNRKRGQPMVILNNISHYINFIYTIVPKDKIKVL